MLRRFEEKRNVLRTVQETEGRLTELVTSCLIKILIEGNVEGTGRQGRGSKQLLDGSKERSIYWKLKEEALDRTVWRTGYGRGCVVCDTRLQTQ